MDRKQVEEAIEAALGARLARLRNWIVGTAAVFFILLVGVMAMLVALIPGRVNTAVAPSTAANVLLVNPRGGAPLSGGAVLDLTEGRLNASHHTLFTTDAEGAAPRRRRGRALLQTTSASDVNLVSWCCCTCEAASRQLPLL
jgi:hypothetical protein